MSVLVALLMIGWLYSEVSETSTTADAPATVINTSMELALLLTGSKIFTYSTNPSADTVTVNSVNGAERTNSPSLSVTVETRDEPSLVEMVTLVPGIAA